MLFSENPGQRGILSNIATVSLRLGFFSRNDRPELSLSRMITDIWSA